jgi:nitroreductase
VKVQHPVPQAKRTEPSLTLTLTLDEVETLLQVARHYEQVMGLMRHVVAFTAPPRTRQKYRFIVLESEALFCFAQETLQRMQAAHTTETTVVLTARMIVAFWGRLLANLRTRRSRRRLKPVEVARREALAMKLETAARALWERDRESLRYEIATRRPIEAGWMLAALDRS